MEEEEKRGGRKRRKLTYDQCPHLNWDKYHKGSCNILCFSSRYYERSRAKNKIKEAEKLEKCT